MDKDVNKEFESLLMFNEIEYKDEEPPEERNNNMSIVELSGIVQDMTSMLWYIQEVMSRVFQEKELSVDSELIDILRNMQEESVQVIEGLDFSIDDDDDDDLD